MKKEEEDLETLFAMKLHNKEELTETLQRVEKLQTSEQHQMGSLDEIVEKKSDSG